MYVRRLLEAMEETFEDLPEMVVHTYQVLDYATTIAKGENVDESDKRIITATAILHDIGMVEAFERHGSYRGRYQEIEGPPIAERILLGEDLTEDEIDRILYIIGNHHSPSKINGIDFQIQWEADLLVNLEDMTIEDDEKKKQYIDENFKTTTGKGLAYRKYLSGE